MSQLTNVFFDLLVPSDPDRGANTTYVRQVVPLDDFYPSEIPKVGDKIVVGGVKYAVVGRTLDYDRYEVIIRAGSP